MIVKTGKAMNAGTDANVFLIIYGKSGRTAIHQLNDRSKNDFERNTSSEFTVRNVLPFFLYQEIISMKN